MAFGTIGGPLICHELFFMIIRVTIRAPAVFNFPGIARFMTTGAGYRLVLSLKRIAGTCMAKVIHSFDLVKGCFRMTLRAGLSKFIVMNIFVTAGAI